MKSVFSGCSGFALGALFATTLIASALYLLIAGDSSADTRAPTPVSVKPEVSVVVSAGYLNAQVKQIVNKSGGVKNPVVNLAAPNIVKVAGTLDLSLAGQRVSTNAALTFRVTVRNGRVVLVVDQTEAGGVAIPQTLIATALENMRAQIEEQINALAQSTLKGTALKLLNVRMTESTLTVELTSQ